MKAEQQRHTGGEAVKEKEKEDDEECVTVTLAYIQQKLRIRNVPFE